MTELLEKSPCPFCGGEPKGYPYGWYVECENCHIRINGISYENAVERWNTRYEPTCHTSNMYENIFECSTCGAMDTDGKPNYCPNCGRRVIEE